MEEIPHAFPNFVPNQVLSSVQLNKLRQYLDCQDRLSRIRLTGTGIVCGLDIRGADNTVELWEGWGISSDGYLLELPAGHYTHWRAYRDPDQDEKGAPSYEPWRRNSGSGPDSQLPLLELLEGEENADTDRPLSSAELDGRVAVLYLELSTEQLRTCLVTDCNNRGVNLRLLPKLLLVEKEHLRKLSGCTRPSRVKLPRLHRMRKLTEVETAEQLNQGYGAAVASVRDTLPDAIRDAFSRYGAALSLGDGVAQVETLKGILQESNVNQYHYDLAADIATAYNEFIEAACRWAPECAAPDDHPRHLMLGALDGEEGWRHPFRPAPVAGQWGGGQARTARLAKRLLAMIDSISPGSAEELRITPSHGEHERLGRRAVPHYFKLGPQVQYWRPDDCCTAGAPWNYRDKEDAADPETLDTDYRCCSLLRIEGHLGQPRNSNAKGEPAIVTLQRQSNFEFNLLTLYLEKPGEREREMLKKLKEERVSRKKAEADLIDAITTAVEKTDSSEAKVKKAYTKARAQAENLERTESQWSELRRERKPLCDTAHLEADYGAFRTETICHFQRLLAGLNKLGSLALPIMEGTSMAQLDANLKRWEAIYEQTREKYKSDPGNPGLREDLVRAEAMNVAFKAQKSLTQTVRVMAIAVLAAGAVWQPRGNGDAAALMENIELLRGEDIRRMLAAGDSISLQGLRMLFLQAMDQLPEEMAVFDLDAFTETVKLIAEVLTALLLVTRLKAVIASAMRSLSVGITERYAGRSMVEPSLSEGLRSGAYHLENLLLLLVRGCRYSHSAYLYELYSHYRENEQHHFKHFASLHPGMEHLAGVEKGGTFVLVAESDRADAPIVADFSLRGRIACCCEPPEKLCLPLVALPDYRIAPVYPKADGDGYELLEISFDLLAGDRDRFEIELPGKSEMGAELSPDNKAGTITYKLEKPVPGAVDRFTYRLSARDSGCGGEATAQVFILMEPELRQEPQVGAITGSVTWNGRGLTEAEVRVGNTKLSAKPDSLGRYMIENLPPGTYALEASLWNNEVISDPLMVKVVAGQTATADFHLPAYQTKLVDVIMTKVDRRRMVTVIKVVRAITGLGLKEAKEMVENVPTTIVKSVSDTKAREIAEQLKGAGASVKIQ